MSLGLYGGNLRDYQRQLLRAIWYDSPLRVSAVDPRQVFYLAAAGLRSAQQRRPGYDPRNNVGRFAVPVTSGYTGWCITRVWIDEYADAYDPRNHIGSRL